MPEVAIAWQGGEPTLMGVEFFRRSVELAQRYLRPGQQAVYTIQTNGTLLDEEWAAFFREHEFLVGISIDGPRELHDAYRVNKGGKGSFDQVIRGLGYSEGGGGRVERAHDRARPKRRPRPRGLPLPAGRVRRPVHAVHSRSSSAWRRPPTGRCRGRRGATGRCTSRRESWSRTARSAASSTAAS